ncbi:hypothetical protein AZI86_12000 [Bdellovibrio bacteriovorus]|uniref:phospholipase D n=1 Tax=Bdellovibrio bacteriovorus TaxID=959 RepID=A0A150WM65_BDEBC|nr:phospholipase D-like domain-containing protein [Bdellovibrio bacteriovorus]KYG64915.1 hypothetical protein AZI86_12000 [Bdellovibrio bacteriovorus]
MKYLISVLVIFFAFNASAKVEALFHPNGPTLETIAQWISEAQSTVDIAMYNMDVKESSPIIATLKSAAVQARLHSGELKIRVNLELYSSPEANTAKRQALEDLGVDVRYLDNKDVKIHHKFAVIDANGPLPRVVTSSANWAVMSQEGYDENFLFFTAEKEVTARYQQEFLRLWKASKEFGATLPSTEQKPVSFVDESDVEVVFNSPRTIEPQSPEKSMLTDEIVGHINGAKKTLEIATARIRLVPILEALRTAANRGVQVQAVIGQDDFRDLGRRARYLVHKNIQVRIKFYNLDINDFLKFQMHNKFMIVDGETLIAGSFNWSQSSEFNHIENIVILTGAKAQEVIPAYHQRFSGIWEMGRDQYASVLADLEKNQPHQCALPPMVLTSDEIKELLKYKADCK